MEREPFVYILASRFRGTIYIGVTSDLMRRIWEHRSGIKSAFPSKYGVWRLVHFEPFGDMERAIAREKQLKNWHRRWKVNLIEEKNPHWLDLALDLGFERMPERREQAACRRRSPDGTAGGGLDPGSSPG
jgi:putative endonuclease